jgi:hypothetical protein
MCSQVGFDGGRYKYMNEGDKSISVTLNLPAGGTAFVTIIPTDGVTLDTEAYTGLMDTTLQKVRTVQHLLCLLAQSNLLMQLTNACITAVLSWMQAVPDLKKVTGLVHDLEAVVVHAT